MRDVLWSLDLDQLWRIYLVNQIENDVPFELILDLEEWLGAFRTVRNLSIQGNPPDG